MASQRGGDAARGKVFLRANGKYDITLVCVRSDEEERYTELEFTHFLKSK